MRLPSLRKPGPGISMWFGRVHVHANIAKTMVWSSQTNDGKHQTDHYISVHMANKVAWSHAEGRQAVIRAFSVVLGPLKITIGRKQR
jgi:hypothetical protein